MSDLPEGWIAAKLEDVCESITDGDHLPPPQVENGVPFLVIGDVRSGSISFEGCRKVPEEYFASLSDSRKPRRGDLLYTVTGSFGIPVLVTTDQPFCVQRHIAILRPAPKTDVRYMRHALATSTSFAQAAAIATGTAQKTVPLRGLRRLTIPLAPSQQQPHIVAAIDAHFSRLDAATATLERVQRNLERYRASVLKAAVEGRLVPTEAELAKKEGRTYEPASVLLKRILTERRRRWEEAEFAKLTAKGKKPTDDKWKAKYEEPAAPDVAGLPELPEGWCWATADMLASSIRNGCSTAPREKDGVRILRISAVRALACDVDNVRFLPLPHDGYEDYFVQPGDLLFTRYNGTPSLVGVCAVVRHLPAPTVHPDKLIRVQLLPGLEVGFIEIAVNVGTSRKHVQSRIRTTAGQAGISGADIKSLPIPLPPIAEQARIRKVADELLTVAAATSTSVAASSARGSRLRQCILKWAFEGRLVRRAEEGQC